MADTKTYVVKKEGFLLGDWKNPNAKVQLNAAQARPFLLEERIVEAPAPAPEKPKAD